MNTKFGVLAWLTLLVFIGVLAATLTLGVIWPSGVQGAYPPTDDSGQAVSFQQSSMVTDVMVTNTPREPGAAAQYTVKFVTGEVLQANVDTIVFDIDSSVGTPSSISASDVFMSASAVTGGGQANQWVALSADPVDEHDPEGRNIYTITVPDMDTIVSPGLQSIDAGATVTVTLLMSAELTNPTESGSDDFTISTSKEPVGVKATFTTPVTLSIDDNSGHRNTPITLVGRGFKNGTTALIYLDRSRDSSGNIVNVPDGMRPPPGTDVDLFYTQVQSDDTFTATFVVTVPPFAPTGVNHLNVIDGEIPPNHYNGMMYAQPPVTFTIEPLLSISSSSAAVGDELNLALVDWPATDQIMDHVTTDPQGVDRVEQSAVTIAGIPQMITSGEGSVGPDNRHTFRVHVGPTVPTGVHQLKVNTYSSSQLESDVPGGASDTKSIAITDALSPGHAPLDLGNVTGDRATLVALYNATDGANWTNNTNWLTNAPLGQWYGVSVRGLPWRVSGLYLAKNQLSGEIPPELGNLTDLTRLDLSGNQLSGTIPSELGSLTSLWCLNLSGNQLSGTIPSELGRLTDLRDLYLYDNQLSVGIPADFGNLTNLVYLDLARNRLSVGIPSELGNLTNLEHLDLTQNQLTGVIPEELGSLTNLATLRLGSNQFSGEIPRRLGSLTNLQLLELNNNQLSGEIPAELGNLTNLAGLFLDRNQLSGEIPEELGNLTNLAGLFLEHNQLSGEIPEELGNLTNLAGLFLEHNQLSGEIPEELGSLTNLEILRLSSNRLTGCVPASLRGVASHDLAELGLPFCDMLNGSPVVVIRFVSEAGAPVRLGSPVSLEAAFNEPVTGFSLEDISVANGVAGNFAGSGSVYAFEVTPNAIGEVTIDVAADTAQGADGKGNIASGLPLGIPYDDDGNGAISKSEVIAAINDYLFGDGSIAKSHVIALINLYLFGPTAA